MCTTCETEICAIFDELVAGYLRDFPPILAADERPSRRRPRYMPLDLSDPVESEASKHRFNDMVQASVGIGYDPGEFMNVLAERTGFGDQVRNWARGKLPNGLARKVILTCAETLIRERGASPTQSLLQAA